MLEASIYHVSTNMLFVNVHAHTDKARKNQNISHKAAEAKKNHDAQANVISTLLAM